MKFLTLALISTALTLSACDPAPNSKNPAPASEREEAVTTLLKTHFPVTVSKIADGVWVHTSAYRVPGRPDIAANGLIVEDGDSLIMVDTPWGELSTLSLLNVIKDDIGKPVKSLIVTHHHVDSVSGVDVLEAQGAMVYTHPDTPARAALLGLPVPNTSVAALKDPHSRSKVGTIEIAYPGPGHAEENLVVYVPSAKVLFAGCTVKGAQSTSLGNIADAKLKDWPNSLNWIKATYPETTLVVPGHGKGAGLTLIDNTLGLIAKQVNAENSESAKTGAAKSGAAKTNPEP